jgi:hypothetical protein
MATVQPTVIATLATGGALADLRNLLFSLALFNPKPPKVYLYCDSDTERSLPSLKYPGRIIANTSAMARYSGLNRQQMERLPGQRFPSLWFDFMAEKISLLKWAFAEEGEGAAAAEASTGILFCDADICFFAPLPSIPVGAHVALSPHDIRAADEARYGRYNGGFVWLSHSRYADIWLTACDAGQRFYEQSALEDVAAAAANTTGNPWALYEFPRTQNYGWWRMWQGEKPPAALQAEFSMNRRRQPEAAGILVAGEPLGSVHTHFTERRDAATVEFNRWLLEWLKRLEAGHEPARRLLGHLARQ